MTNETYILSKVNNIPVYNSESFFEMRKAGALASHILNYITPYVVPGVDTEYLDKLCYNEIIRHNALPAPLGYKGYPKSICTSINHVICHGIPSKDMILKEGDIVNIDVTVILNGWYGDTSRMFLVGDKILPNAKMLCKVTYEAMMLAIESVKPGLNLSEVGRIINDHANENGYSVVRDFCGHGIGRIFHDEPQVLHYKNKGNIILEEGMFFTIEPMINEGSWQSSILSDGWTAVTKDRSLSAQWEHTIGVTSNGYEIFTSY
ncbi:type I methionyl aminopeptidase [Lyticum sinuosum]|uniref:Methionine aminopeptidase n=1 Tax=Lyticum sinuosum TaxID=1332059 RepID=A0AAE4VKG5_9RICK|nr:type I methionyl aminopeptidase [Lyticum sinuosum]MDZ5761457.1 Methionine aminopeptidase [Lyticum sinuosum]